jgi:hypothetical protein
MKDLKIFLYSIAFKKLRKIEARMLAAIDLKKNWSSANMRVEVDKTSICVLLHNNLICQIKYNWPVSETKTKNLVCLKDAGWQTVTTKSRLNQLASFFGVPGIYQKAFKWYSDNGKEWNGWAEYEIPSDLSNAYARKYYKHHC